jgi:hypothetical protein
VISPSPNKPFFKPDVWGFPQKTGSSAPESQLGFKLIPLFASLCHPVEPMQLRWASVFFQSVALVARDISSLPVYEKPNDPTNKLGPELAIINYYIKCIEGPNNSSQISDTSSPSKITESKTSFVSLEKFIDSIHQMLLAFAILKARCKMNRDTQSLAKYSSQFSSLPSEYISRTHYMLLASFCVSGVHGLFLTPADPKTFLASKCFLLLSVVAKVKSIQPPPDVLEPVWKRTNAYICSIINSAFFSTSGFTPTRISRYELAKSIVLDFSEHCLNVHPEGDHIFNVPKRSDCPYIKDL